MILRDSDASKSLAVFKAVMKHNKEIKKTAQRQGRMVDAKRQLKIAREMVAGTLLSSPSYPQELKQPHASPADRPGCADGGPKASAAAVGDVSVGATSTDTKSEPAVVISVDLEWSESDQSRLLEIGWSVWDSVSRSVTSK